MRLLDVFLILFWSFGLLTALDNTQIPYGVKNIKIMYEQSSNATEIGFWREQSCVDNVYMCPHGVSL